MHFHKKPNHFVSHITLKVQDLERSLRFYEDVLGFHILHKTKREAHLTTDGTTSILELKQPEDIIPKQKNATGLYHFALLVPTHSDLAHLIYHIREAGLSFGAADHLVSEAIYLDDPDGNGIEIYYDRDPAEWTWEQGKVVMTVDPLDFTSLLTESNQQLSRGLPTETIIGHLHLQVANLKKSEDFYTKGLGFETVSRFSDQAAFLSTGKYHHHVALNTWGTAGASPAPLNSVGLEAFTVTIANEAARNKIITRLKKLGATITEDNDVIFTHDLSGNRIYLTL